MKDLIYGRELRLMEITAIGFRLFVDNIKTILKGVFLICLPISILVYLIQLRVLNVYEILDAISQAQTSISDGEIMALSKQMGLNNLLTLGISVFLEPIFVMGVMKTVKQSLDGRKAKGIAVYNAALLQEGNVVKTGLIYGGCLFISSLLIFPGIYLMVIWYFYLCCIGLLGKKGGYALAHSRDMVQGRWWRTFGFILFLSILGMGWNSILQMFFIVLPQGVVRDVLFTCVTYFTQGYMTCCMTVLFLNREAGLFGLEGLAEKSDAEIAENKSE